MTGALRRLDMFNITWEIATSDGKNYYEGKAPFEFKEGDRLPFARLQDFLVENKLEVTFCALRAPDGRTWNLHAHKQTKNKKGDYIGRRHNPRFQAWDLTQPFDYNVFRKIGSDKKVSKNKNGDLDIKQVEEEIFTVGEAIYPQGVMQVWVPESNPRHSWNIFIPTDYGSSIRPKN